MGDKLKGEHTIYDESSEDERKLNELVEEGGREVFSTTTVFPFTFFPDSVTIQESKVTLTYRPFFFSKATFPFLIKDLRLVTADTNPFFGTMRFELIGYEMNPPIISYLPAKEAITAKNIITGLLKARDEDIDLSEFTVEELRDKLIQIGETQAPPAF